MIHEFKKSHPIIFFPVSWANSITRWILGPVSKSGTIRITNTPDPGSEGACSFDVNVDSVYKEIAQRLKSDFVSKSELGKEIADRSNGSISDQGGTIHTKGTESPTGPSGSQQPSGGSSKYGVRFGFDNVMNGIYPTTIKWMAVGSEENLDTYTGETTWNGYAVGAFSCNTAANNYPVKVIVGDLLTGALSARPVRIIENGIPGDVIGIEFGSMRDLMLNTANKVSTNLYKAKYSVKPTFNQSGILTRLDFGTEEQIGNDQPASTVSTAIGCPYNS